MLFLPIFSKWIKAKLNELESESDNFPQNEGQSWQIWIDPALSLSMGFNQLCTAVRHILQMPSFSWDNTYSHWLRFWDFSPFSTVWLWLWPYVLSGLHPSTFTDIVMGVLHFLFAAANMNRHLWTNKYEQTFVKFGLEQFSLHQDTSLSIHWHWLVPLVVAHYKQAEF